MSHLQTIRVNNLNKNAGDLSKRGSSAVSQLNSCLLEATKIACKMHKNTKGDVDAELLAKLQSDIDNALAGYPACTNILTDLSSLRADPSTVDAIIAKYNIDLAEFDSQLEQS